MAYNETLALRIQQLMHTLPGDFVQRKMFGGLAFLYKGKMCCGIVKNHLMVRVCKSKYEEMLKHPYAREMDFTGKPMKGFLFVDKGGFSTDKELLKWVLLGKDYVDRHI